MQKRTPPPRLFPKGTWFWGAGWSLCFKRIKSRGYLDDFERIFAAWPSSSAMHTFFIHPPTQCLGVGPVTCKRKNKIKERKGSETRKRRRGGGRKKEMQKSPCFFESSLFVGILFAWKYWEGGYKCKI